MASAEEVWCLGMENEAVYVVLEDLYSILVSTVTYSYIWVDQPLVAQDFCLRLSQWTMALVA